MKISYKHLSSFLNDKPTIKEVSDKLFQLGHEHEILGDIFDIEFTPNRGDCLSLLGLSRDLNVFFDNNNEIEIYDNNIPELEIEFINNAKDSCPEISFMMLEVGKEISNYKNYLEDFFNDLKINKNNFFTDISNYLSYEIGQPTHCYDFEKIKGNFVLEETNKEKSFKTLLGNNIKLVNKNTVFTLDNQVINLAGVMGGINTSCKNSTRKVLIEAAYFNPEKIIGQSVKYDLVSDAAYKFERGVDSTNQEFALRRFAKIVSDHTKIKKISYINKKYQLLDVLSIPSDLNHINKILGTNVTNKTYFKIMSKLGFIINNGLIEVPSYRNDIKNQNDIAEEIARVIGYDEISRKGIFIKSENKDNNLIESKLKSILVDNGFNEVINFPFSAEHTNNSISVDNPLDKNKSFLRNNLQDSLVSNLIYNEKRQNDSIKFFEISDIYTRKDKKRVIGIIASGRQGHSYKNFSKEIDKSYLEEVLFNFSEETSMKIINIDRKEIDSKSKKPIFYIELELEEISNEILKSKSISSYPSSFIKYQKISEFPSTYRDISFSINDPNVCEELQNKLLNYKSTSLKKSFVFDYFENKESLITKIGFRFIFQVNHKTLTDKEVDEEISKILSISDTIKSVEVPGLKK